jgi:amino acid permease
VDAYLRVTFGEGRPSNSRWQAILLLINSSVGSGILNQPMVFKEAGP